MAKEERKLAFGWAGDYDAGVSYVDKTGKLSSVAGHINIRQDGHMYAITFSDGNGNQRLINYPTAFGLDKAQHIGEVLFPRWREESDLGRLAA